MTKCKGSADFVSVWGSVMSRIGQENSQIVMIDADLAKAAGSYPFRDAFPDRHFNVGISEQDMLCFASGLAEAGKIPFVVSFGCFITQRGCDQIINAVAYNKSNVKMVGIGAGLTCAKNGGTHMAIVDIAIMRSIPGLRVFDPADALEFGKIIEYTALMEGPVYIRSSRGMLPVIFDEDMVFHPGKAIILHEGKAAALITTGATTSEGILACKALAEENISIKHLHIPQLKPIDKEAIIQAASETGRIVTCENHSVIGGLGSSVTEVLSEAYPVPVYRLGLQDVFGETADFNYLKHKFGIDATAIKQKILEIIDNK